MTEKYLSSFADQESALSYTGGGGTLISPQVSLIEGDTELVYSKEIPHGSKIKFERDDETGKLYFVVDGPSYEMVDLGLSVKWADRNVGASSPEEYGLYFSWGNVDGHAVDENGNIVDGYPFDETTYASTPGGQFTGSTLDPEHDAATVNMGEGWRIPTIDEINELINGTDQTVDTENGGMILTSKNNGNSIFIPFAGYCKNSLLDYEGSGGGVWSSSLHESLSSGARNLLVGSSGSISSVLHYVRYLGLSIRGVQA